MTGATKPILFPCSGKWCDATTIIASMITSTIAAAIAPTIAPTI
jgi:hypothetical protein